MPRPKPSDALQGLVELFRRRPELREVFPLAASLEGVLTQ